MPLLVDAARPGSAATGERPGDAILTVGLINNMPDAALVATERQFTALLHAAADGAVVRVKLFTMPEVPRADSMRREIAERYRGIAELWDSRLDGLIVTGTEPRAANLREEPYWPALAKVVDWAKEHTGSTIWSCLAAHAAVLHADGVERRPLAEKRFGIFDCDVIAAHSLTKGIGHRLRVPHSRHNDLPETALAACGYRRFTRSTMAGADMFAKEEPNLALFLFFQGHPEYEAVTLLREYRRDIGRFLRGEREHYPAAPRGYFDGEAMAIVNAFRARAMRARGDGHAAEFVKFPMDALAGRLASPWRRCAIGIYHNWLAYLRERHVERRSTYLLPCSQHGRWSNGNWSNGAARSIADGSSAG